MYMKQAEDSSEKAKQLYNDLSDCEKYMWALFEIPLADKKLDCLYFRSQFRVRLEELVDAIQIIERACDEVRSSERLRQMIAYILTVVNQINTGGEAVGAVGFSLDALLKLNEVRYKVMFSSSSRPYVGESVRQEDKCTPISSKSRQAEQRRLVAATE
mgnify:CR=1 FL=1